MLPMDRKNKSGVVEICRKFTNLMGIHQTGPVTRTTGASDYFVLLRVAAPSFRMTVVSAGRSALRLMRCGPGATWRELLQRGLPGLTAAALLTLTHGGAHAQRDAATTPHDWIGQKGTASYYGRAHQGRRTASGDRFDENELTAAHPWLPFGSKVRVTLQGTGRSVVVTITDRLYSARRVIDLSLAAARLLGIAHQGIGTVSLSPA